MKYTKPAEVEYDAAYDPEGERVDRFVTRKVNAGDVFADEVTKLVLRTTGRDYGNPEILLTTRYCWSGYSEYTVTNQWQEIILTAPRWNWEHEWPSLGEFFRALAEANPDADRP